MKLLRIAQRCVRNGVSQHQLNQLQIAKTFCTNSFDIGKGDNQNSDSWEPTDVFERRIFGGMSSDSSNSFYQKLDRLQKARHGPGMDADFHGDRPSMFDGDGEDFSTLTDGMEGKLKKSATDFEINEEEVAQEDYSFRPDMNFKSGMTYTPKDLDLRKPGVWRPSKKSEFEVTTEEVLRKADFRNVRFLANFLTEAGIIIKRSKTGISAKAQRKVAREIKTARAFGLLPFTTMGTKPFVFGRTMEDLDHDFELENQERLAADEIQDVVEQ